MYGQFQNPASAAKWIFFGFVGVILMAILLGIDFKSATWLNSQIADAQARDLNVETTYKEQQYQLALEQEQIHLQAERERLAQEIANQKALDNLAITNRQIAFDTWMNVIGWIGGAISIAIILWVGSKALAVIRSIPPKEKTMKEFTPTIKKNIPNVPEREPYEPLEEPRKRLYERRVNERLQELTTEQKEMIDVLAARLSAYSNPANMSKDKYNKQPLAG